LKGSFALVLFSFLILGCSQASQPKRGHISGIVLDDFGNPVMEAEVKAEPDPPPVLTDPMGRFAITDLPAGGYLLTVTKPEYNPTTKAVVVKEGEVTNVEIKISSPLVISIQTVLNKLVAISTSDDPAKLGGLPGLFSKKYRPSDDPDTRWAVALGAIPADYESLIPGMRSFFEKFRDITASYQLLSVAPLAKGQVEAKVRYSLSVVSDTPDAKPFSQSGICTMLFSYEEGAWVILSWSLLEYWK